jgi:hypothetical protein
LVNRRDGRIAAMLRRHFAVHSTSALGPVVKFFGQRCANVEAG